MDSPSAIEIAAGLKIRPLLESLGYGMPERVLPAVDGNRAIELVCAWPESKNELIAVLYGYAEVFHFDDPVMFALVIFFAEKHQKRIVHWDQFRHRYKPISGADFDWLPLAIVDVEERRDEETSWSSLHYLHKLFVYFMHMLALCYAPHLSKLVVYVPPVFRGLDLVEICRGYSFWHGMSVCEIVFVLAMRRPDWVGVLNEFAAVSEHMFHRSRCVLHWTPSVYAADSVQKLMRNRPAYMRVDLFAACMLDLPIDCLELVLGSCLWADLVFLGGWPNEAS